MERKTGTLIASRFMTADPQLVEHIAEQILRDEAWWIAARTGKYVLGSTVWADQPCDLGDARSADSVTLVDVPAVR
jgi:hypothetical protein